MINIDCSWNNTIEYINIVLSPNIWRAGSLTLAFNRINWVIYDISLFRVIAVEGCKEEITTKCEVNSAPKNDKLYPCRSPIVSCWCPLNSNEIEGWERKGLSVYYVKKHLELFRS